MHLAMDSPGRPSYVLHPYLLNLPLSRDLPQFAFYYMIYEFFLTKIDVNGRNQQLTV